MGTESYFVCMGHGFGTAYEDLLAEFDSADIANVDVDRDDPCWLFFTSGSTGRPKAVVLTHGQLTFIKTDQ